MSTNTKGPFRADHVGSLLRPAKLQQSRIQRQRKNITPERLREVEDESIREVVKLQEDIGLQGITDGELRRDYWHLDFLMVLTVNGFDCCACMIMGGMGDAYPLPP